MHPRHRGRSSVDSSPPQNPGALPIPSGTPVVLSRNQRQLGALLEGSDPDQDASFVLVNARHGAVAIPHSISLRRLVVAQRTPRQILAGPRGCNCSLAILLPLDHERGGSGSSRRIILLAASRDQLFGLCSEFLRSVRPRTISSQLTAVRFRGRFRRALLHEHEVFGFLAILRVALAVTVFGRRRGILVLWDLARAVSGRGRASLQSACFFEFRCITGSR